ncbi:MAG: poly-gamma-glutamate synthase PgsB [Ignavibacteria bacterium]|nr:poly-gamma-glutamate synthase PgsB [Ignavibacteria bacterium]
MTILLLTLIVLLLFLVYERVVLNRLRNSIPLVVAVTGTRGKSSVVRMLASVLREAGDTVLAKTTGSQAQFVLPDGTAQDVPRRGIVSILEQKKVLKKAVELRANCLVVEIMSIRPENHFVESQQILKPDIVLVTNVRRDHTEAMGETETEIASVLRLDVPSTASVYVPEEFRSLLDPQSPGVKSLRISSVRQGCSDPLRATLKAWKITEFAENLDLVASVVRDLGVPDDIASRGIENARHDIGKFRVWTYRIGGKRVFLVNAFAANDPDSTMRIYEKTRQTLAAAPALFTGLLNLRYDRPDRTVQWIEALQENAPSHFKSLYVVGGHAHVVRRKVKTASVLTLSSPDEITNVIAETMEEDGILFGFGNIGGAGRRLVEHWQRVGEEYGI